MTEQTVKCPICGEPYKVYSHMAGDQSACQQCQRKAESKGGTYTGEHLRWERRI